MNSNIIPTITAGLFSIIAIILNNIWSSIKENKKRISQLGLDADKNQMDFSNILRNELRVENIELNKRVNGMEQTISELLFEKERHSESYNVLKTTYLTLMEQHGELRIQYATSVTTTQDLLVKYEKSLVDSGECTRMYNELQLKYEHLLAQVAELKGTVNGGNNHEIQV